jgi:MFS transporter, DHA3 family, macrolide efflux protein
MQESVPVESMTQPLTSARADTKRPFDRSFFALIVGQFLANLGNSVYQLALMWEMKVLTGSTVMMSTVSIAMLVPLIVLGPIAGVMVDRWPKRLAMIGSDVFRFLIVAIMSSAVLLHVAAPWMLIATAALCSVAGSIYNPANNALLPLLVGKESLQQANSISQSSFVSTQILGPIAGALLIAHVSMSAAFFSNAVGFLFSVLSLLFVRVSEPVRMHSPLQPKTVVAEMKDGLKTLFDLPSMRVMTPVALIANFLFAPFEIILIQYCTKVLHGGVQLYGTMGSFMAVGMLCGAILAGVIAKRIRKGVLLQVSLPMMSVPIIALAFIRVPWLALIMAVLFGLFNMTVNILFMTMMQEMVPQEKLGRVSGSLGIVFQGAQPFAQAIGGVLLAYFTVPALIAAIGVLETINASIGAATKVIRSIE